ncbi:MFS general substrate transporter [Aspergillus bertholletiae]|uniref:MFS general substrate transporter n=1 Tax=Aspergillus bertholletiae TaxID=1226010 RepID=A0A5N7AUF8_9EURO|nr:MFS general substrate transporter [Aspergillus bertholletiae]
MQLWRLNSPFAQNFLASIIVGLGPGLYVAVTNLGAGGGPANATKMQNVANLVLYTIYFVAGFSSGSVVTMIGPKYTLAFGTLGYPIYVGSLWYFGHTGNLWFPILGGAILGITAIHLWTAAGFIAFSYATEDKKGTYISMQWCLLSVGSIVASFVAFGINFNAGELACPDSVYIVFIILMALSLPVALFGIISPANVRRVDGSPIAHYAHRGFWEELKEQRRIFMDWRMLVLLIPMFGSEVSIVVFSSINCILNSVIFVILQGFGAIVTMVLLDYRRIGNRRVRGIVSITTMGLLTLGLWIGLALWLSQHPINLTSPPLWDWTDGPFGGFIVLTLLFGINMAAYQIVVQWIVASLSNSPDTLARFAGFAKGCLAGGLCATFGTEAAGLEQISVMAWAFTLQGVGLVCMVAVTWLSVRPTNYGKEDTTVARSACHQNEERVLSAVETS